MTMTMTAQRYAEIEQLAIAAEVTPADYAAADKMAQQEFERGGRLAKRNELYDGFGVLPEDRERWAKAAAFERVMREHNIVPAVIPLHSIGQRPAWTATVDCQPSNAVVLAMPRKDQVCLVEAGGLVFCDCAGDVLSGLRRAGYQVVYWYGAKSRSHVLGNRYYTGDELADEFALVLIGPARRTGPQVGEEWGCGIEFGLIEKFTADSRAIIRQTKPGGLVAVGQTFALPIRVLSPEYTPDC